MQELSSVTETDLNPYQALVKLIGDGLSSIAKPQYKTAAAGVKIFTLPIPSSISLINTG